MARKSNNNNVIDISASPREIGRNIAANAVFPPINGIAAIIRESFRGHGGLNDAILFAGMGTTTSTTPSVCNIEYGIDDPALSYGFKPLDVDADERLIGLYNTEVPSSDPWFMRNILLMFEATRQIQAHLIDNADAMGHQDCVSLYRTISDAAHAAIAVSSARPAATGDPLRDLEAETSFQDDKETALRLYSKAIGAVARGQRHIITATINAAMEQHTAKAAELREKIQTGMIAGIRRMRVESASHGLPIGDPDPVYQMGNDTKALFNSLLFQMVNSGGKQASNVLLVGETGVGKTKLAVEFAAWARLPILIVEAYEHRYASAFYGGMRLINGETLWVDSLFADRLPKGNIVICIDEITRAEPTSVNAFLPLLDWRRAAQIDEAGKRYEVGSNTFFFATANVGSAYTGTYRMDEALQNRFGVRVDVTLPDLKTLETIMSTVISQPKPVGDTVEKDISGWSPHGITQSVIGKLARAITEVNQQVLGGSKDVTRIISPREAIEAADWYTLLGPKGIKLSIIDKFPRNVMVDQRKNVADIFNKNGIAI